MSKIIVTKDKADAIRELWQRAEGDAAMMKVRGVVLLLCNSLAEAIARAERAEDGQTALAQVGDRYLAERDAAREQVAKLREVLEAIRDQRYSGLTIDFAARALAETEGAPK